MVSLKLEGRMKRAEYVATVTAVYRKALDEMTVTKPMMDALYAAFNRQGFTDGYYTSRVDTKMFGVRQENDDDGKWLQAARQPTKQGRPPCGLPLSGHGHRGRQLRHRHRPGGSDMPLRRPRAGTRPEHFPHRGNARTAGLQDRRYALPVRGGAHPGGSRSHYLRFRHQRHAPGTC